MLQVLMLLAEDPAQPPQGAPPWTSFVPLALLFFALYFVWMRPMQRQESERRATISRLKKNDKIVNAGGIIGIVDSIKEQEDEIILKGGVRILRSSVVKIVSADEANKEGEK